jgi:hypothetical protein
VALSNPHDPGMYLMKWHLNLFMTKKHLSSCGGLGPWGFRRSKSNKSNRSVIFPILIFGFHLCVSWRVVLPGKLVFEMQKMKSRSHTK